jgi:hypothetical protein
MIVYGQPFYGHHHATVIITRAGGGPPQALQRETRPNFFGRQCGGLVRRIINRRSTRLEGRGGAQRIYSFGSGLYTMITITINVIPRTWWTAKSPRRVKVRQSERRARGGGRTSTRDDNILPNKNTNLLMILERATTTTDFRLEPPLSSIFPAHSKMTITPCPPQLSRGNKHILTSGYTTITNLEP